MKRHLSTLAAALFCTGFLYAQEKKATPTPAAKAAFEKQFPGTDKVKWEREKAGYEVNFHQQGHEMSAVFDAQGSLQETETEIAVTALPTAVQDYVKQHYAGHAIKEAAKIVKADGTVQYEAAVNKQDVLFDSAGKFLQTAKD